MRSIKLYLENTNWLFLDRHLWVTSNWLVHQPIVRCLGCFRSLWSLEETIPGRIWASTARSRSWSVTTPRSLTTCSKLLVQNWVRRQRFLHWLLYSVQIHVWARHNILVNRWGWLSLWFFRSFLCILERISLLKEILELKMDQLKLRVSETICFSIDKVLNCVELVHNNKVFVIVSIVYCSNMRVEKLII